MSAVAVREKSVVTAVVLTVLFGCLGLFYVSAKWAVVWIVGGVAYIAGLVAAVMSVTSEGAFLGLAMLAQIVGLGFWCGPVIQAVVLTQRHNSLLHESAPVDA